MSMKYAATFEGIGGFGLGFHRAGWEPTVQVELRAERRKVLAQFWPDTPRGENVREAHGRDLGNPDLLVGGFPCKNLMVTAPNRIGLAGRGDDQSGLYWEFIRLLEEQLRLIDESRPRWAVMENVPGLLTSNGGRDMEAVLRGLVELGYGVSYRIMDARYFGVPQRRPRVIVVGHRSGDPRVAWQVLDDIGPGGLGSEVYPEPAGLRGPSAPDGTVRPGVTWFRKVTKPRASAAEGGYAVWRGSSYAHTLTTSDTGSSARQPHLILDHGRLRTLTRLEWERLQGFPDGWTASISESAAQLALGDAMCVPMAEWLAHRIQLVDDQVRYVDFGRKVA